MSTSKSKKMIIAVLAVLLILAICIFAAFNWQKTISSTVSKDAKFDCADLAVGSEDFEKAGFSFGDSCDVEFSNGFKLENVPYYNGYYVKTGSPVIVAYPNNDYVLIAYNNRSLWTTEGLSDGDTVKVTLREKGAFASTQETFSQTYSDNRSDYSSNEEFANFRALKGGNLKENFLFRGASPYDNGRGRARIANSLIEQEEVRTLIDLADTNEEVENNIISEGFKSRYAKSMYDEGRVAALGMSSNQDSAEYKTSLAQGLRLLLKNGGPAYIHCMEGKDRTGFVCMLLEAFAGASYEEMCDDYMQTYANYYGITKESDAEKYDAICSLYFDAFCEYLADSQDDANLKTLSYSDYAKKYLQSCGLSDEEIQALKETITN